MVSDFDEILWPSIECAAQEVVALVISVGHDTTHRSRRQFSLSPSLLRFSIPYNRLQDRIHITLIAEL
jgi:hypothetical protein